MGSELYDFATGGSAMLPLTGTLGAGLAERRPIQQPETAAASTAAAAAPPAPEAALQAAPPPPGAMPFALPLPPPLPAAPPPQPQQPIVTPAPVPVPVPVPAPAVPAAAQAPAQPSAKAPSAKAAWLALPEAQRLGLIGWLGSPYQPVEMQAAARVLAEVAEDAAPDLQGVREMAAALSDIAARLAAKVGG